MSIRDDWATPWDFYTAFLERLDACSWPRPVVDVCATAENRKCDKFYDRAIDALAVKWSVEQDTTFWCNPGYSRVKPWIRKAVEEASNGATTYLLTLCDPSTLWWDFCDQHASDCWLIAPRIQFDPPEGVVKSSNSKPSALWKITYFGKVRDCEYEHWRWR